MNTSFAYVGCRTNAARRAEGKGISVYAMTIDAPWALLQIEAADDPCFLAVDSQKRWLFAVEGDGTKISAFARDADSGKISLINTQPVHGKNPVHVLISPDNRYAVVCNHLTEDGYVSNLAIFPISADGALGGAADVLPVQGDIGVNRKEQPFAKPHHAQFSPDGETIAMADKGLDEVQFFSLSSDGKLSWLKAQTVRMPWGAGPRHLAYHPTLPYLYVLNELDSTVVAIALKDPAGKPKAFQRLSSQSEKFSLIHRAAEIEISADGLHLYVSNRGQNTIGAFAIDPASGALAPISFTPSAGLVPRHFVLFARAEKMFVANEFSHTIMQFDVAGDGDLSNPIKVADSGSPTCILIV